MVSGEEPGPLWPRCTLESLDRKKHLAAEVLLIFCRQILAPLQVSFAALALMAEKASQKVRAAFGRLCLDWTFYSS